MKMKLHCHYEDIKQAIFKGLEDKNVSISALGIYFKEVQYNKANGDFNRACAWVGFELNTLWKQIYREIEHLNINDEHIKTMYKKFFEELNFNRKIY